MSTVIRCDCCGESIQTSTYGYLTVYDFDDGYNTDRYEISLDICGDCLNKKFDRKEIVNGRRNY